MYVITNSIVEAAVDSDCRTFRARMEFLDSEGDVRRTLSGQDLGKITIEHAQTENDTVQIGGVLSRKAEIRICCGYLPKKGDVFQLSLYLLDIGGTSAAQATHAMVSQWSHRELFMLSHRQIAHLPPTKDIDGTPLENYFIPFGEFVVRRAVVEGSLVRVTAFDKLYDADAPYTPTITFPASSIDVTVDVLRQLGIGVRAPVDTGNLIEAGGEPVVGSDGEEILVSAEYSFAIRAEDVEGLTCREVLGGIAAMSGGNGLLDRNGAYTVEFANFTESRQLKNDRIHASEIGDEVKTITGLTCVVDDETTLSAGSIGTVIEFRCPWMTQSRLHKLWARLNGYKWHPASIDEKIGDPRRDLGDRVRYVSPALAGMPSVEYFPLLTGVRYEFDGGFSVEITSCGDTEVF